MGKVGWTVTGACILITGAAAAVIIHIQSTLHDRAEAQAQQEAAATAKLEVLTHRVADDYRTAAAVRQLTTADIDRVAATDGVRVLARDSRPTHLTVTFFAKVGYGGALAHGVVLGFVNGCYTVTVIGVATPTAASTLTELPTCPPSR